jgi:hypothetical protein
MYKSAEDLRDLLSLARLLRDFADHHGGDVSRDSFVSTAEALEARVHFLADTPEVDLAILPRDMPLYAPVNRLV